MKRFLYLCLAVFLIWSFYDRETTVTLGPGIHAPGIPSQTRGDDTAFPFGDYLITPLADFSLRAKVLSRKDYDFDRESDLSPTDLALGWGRMSDEEILNYFTVSQRNRWYFWQADTLPIPQQEVIHSSANMPLIPANSEVANQLKKIRRGDVVALTGKLVRVEGNDGWRWVSSLSRNDSGSGACELIWVTKLVIHST